jgi:formylglycine-generating enzyme required for sulfatase activity
MSEIQPISRPPAANDHFVGREDLFSWLETELAKTDAAENPLLIYGDLNSGKSAILRQLSQGRLGTAFFPIYFDFAQIATHSLSAALWDLALITRQALKSNFDLTHADFLAKPVPAFNQQLLVPAKTVLMHKAAAHHSAPQPLFLGDNLQIILQKIGDGRLDNSFLHTFLELFAAGDAPILFTVDETDLPDAVHDEWLTGSRVYSLAPLAPAAARELISLLLPMVVVKDVADHMVTLTGGHPRCLHLLCAQIADSFAPIQLLTVADVTAVARQNPDLQACLPNPGTTYRLKSRHPYASLIWWNRRTKATAGAIVGLILLFLFWPLIVTQPMAQRVGAVFVPPTDTPTPTYAPPTDTPTPVPVLVTVLTPTPVDTATPTPTFTSTATPSPTITPTPTMTPSPTPLRFPPQILREQDGMEMVLVPAGTFSMGAGPDDPFAGVDEKPVHTVFLNRFYIDKYEVTVEQYAAFLNDRGNYIRACNMIDCAHPRNLAGYTSFLTEEDLGEGTVQYYAIAGFARHPINHVSWYGANEYCAYVGGRLPTEAEWEYAARGDDGRIYPWGNEPPDPFRAVYRSNSYEDIQPVDAIEAGRSPFGALGMAGSMWEWTADWYNESYYAESPPENPTGPETGFARVIRGGAWPFNNTADRLRSTNRNSLAPDFLSAVVGFRCVVEP